MRRVTENQALAVALVQRLIDAGVRTFCVCPGGRNAPLVEVLDALPPRAAAVLSFFDERSAGFFALGRARRDRAPVVVVTTSGTAAAELLPAMVEAFYSVVPLVALTADRPRAYRGTGAPQAIEQAGLFGTYATPALDLERAGEAAELPPIDGPCHINACFSEPLLAGWDSGFAPALDRPSPSRTDRTPAGATGAGLDEFLDSSRSPLVLVGGLHDAGDVEPTARFCRALGAPVAAEASSHIRSAPGVPLLRTGDAAIRRGFDRRLFDGVIRIGDVPSFRVWRDLESSLSVPVFSMSRKPWRGLTRGTHVRVPAGQPLPLPDVRGAGPRGDERELLEWDRRLSGCTGRMLAELPRSEPALVRRLSETIPKGSFVYLGNSLPIREWNQFATFADRRFTIGENRGANGIDGQVSSFLGWAAPDAENWAVVGDLTALYDLSAPWALSHLEGVALRIVVINNGGGRIFRRMFGNERFQNRHATRFEAWAALWGAAYFRDVPGPADRRSPAVIELCPDEAETAGFWARFDEEALR